MNKIGALVIGIHILASFSLSGQDQEEFMVFLRGPYLGQTQPGNQSKVFAPDFVSTEFGELNSVFNRDGNEFYFSRRGVPGKHSPDGQCLFYTSGKNGNEDIFWVSAEAIEKLQPVEDVFKVLEIVNGQTNASLWPNFKTSEIPVLVFDRINTWLFNSKSMPDGFSEVQEHPGVYRFAGQHPLVWGNSIVRTDDAWVATSESSPLDASTITNGIAPAGIRDLGYVEGRWIAMILDKLNPGWKSVLEGNDALYLEDILAKTLQELPVEPKRFTALEIDSLTTEAKKDFSTWQDRNFTG